MVHKFKVELRSGPIVGTRRITLSDESGRVAYIHLSQFGHLSGWVDFNALVYSEIFEAIRPLLMSFMANFTEWERILEK